MHPSLWAQTKTIPIDLELIWGTKDVTCTPCMRPLQANEIITSSSVQHWDVNMLPCIKSKYLFGAQQVAIKNMKISVSCLLGLYGTEIYSMVWVLLAVGIKSRVVFSQLNICSFMISRICSHCWLNMNSVAHCHLCFPSALWWLAVPPYWLWAWCLCCSTSTVRDSLACTALCPMLTSLYHWSQSSSPAHSACSSTTTDRSMLSSSRRSVQGQEVRMKTVS